MDAVIPNKYFYIWSGKPFPYLNLLAVKSLLLADNSATAMVYVIGPEPQNENFENLRGLDRVSILCIEPGDIFSQLPSDLRSVEAIFHKTSESSASARSNILRYALLYLHGGVYLDFDTVVTKSLSDLVGHQCFIGEEKVWAGNEGLVAGKWWVCIYPRNLFWLASWLLRRADSAWCGGKLQIAQALEKTDSVWSKKQPNNAVMGAVPESSFVRELLLGCLDVDFTVRYATGPTLVSRIAKNFPQLVTVLPVHYFYSVAPGESFRLFSDQTLTISNRAYLIHYVASNHKKLIPAIDATCSWTRSANTVMAELITTVESRFDKDQCGVSAASHVSHPLVSCLMVTANRVDIARIAIECFLEQTWPNKELVIIDDGDEDYSHMIAEFDCSDSVKYIKLEPASPRLSLGELRNFSIDKAQGDWCVQWDDDEWYHPERLALQYDAAVQAGVGASALKWTLMHVKQDSDESLTFRGDSGIATPGTLMFRKGGVRYPHVARNEDGIFLRDVKASHGLVVLDEDYSHLFIRVFHGANTWEKDHFLARLHRRVVDWPSWAWSRWIVSDVTAHRAFKLTSQEKESLRQMTHSYNRAKELVSL